MVQVAQAYKVVRKKRITKKNKRAKEVKPNGHGEAARGHELYLHELASISSMMVIP
jgi:hypothetical protein